MVAYLGGVEGGQVWGGELFGQVDVTEDEFVHLHVSQQSVIDVGRHRGVINSKLTKGSLHPRNTCEQDGEEAKSSGDEWQLEQCAVSGLPAH